MVRVKILIQPEAIEVDPKPYCTQISLGTRYLLIKFGLIFVLSLNNKMRCHRTRSRTRLSTKTIEPFVIFVDLWDGRGGTVYRAVNRLRLRHTAAAFRS